eukprot:TRINITY_DN7933_c0_g1_i1.p1 TRINITY_DN7933_c0_g1~~TRINITY_DN7933_c0_g1_i1.p1  ORF type:complete len:346 (+),score=32.05 TRINITY_DN7933_c0_g1_i1:36-1073(+)
MADEVPIAPVEAPPFVVDRVLGSGTFGTVYLATVAGTGEVVAIKQVLQDRRFRNRELSIMQLLSHPNLVGLKHCFFSSGQQPDQVYLNLVLEYVPETLYGMVRKFARLKQTIPLLYVKLFAYQILRGLAYVHASGICHRDIKPQNVLIDRNTAMLKLCDFGSAKRLVALEPNVSYIASRYYRAPECLLGSTFYTQAIDVWAAGCVISEMFLGRPLFSGTDSADQLVHVICVLGTPTHEQLSSMNPEYAEFRFPSIPQQPWNRVFRNVADDGIDLIQRMLRYPPLERIHAIEALAHPFFDELRDAHLRLPNGGALPELFSFTQDELSLMGPLAERIIPPHLRLPSA